MNVSFQWTDIVSISPLCILLIGSLLLLVLESIIGTKKQTTNNLALFICCGTLLLALIAARYSGESNSPLLTRWIRFDYLAQIFTIFFIIIGLSVALISSSKRDNEEENTTYNGEYYFLLISCVIGLVLIGASADFLTLFIGLETLSISLYILCGFCKTRIIGYEAAMKYFFIGAFGAALLLYGIALIYGSIGSTQLTALKNSATQVHTGQDQLLFFAGIAFLTIGLCFKAAVVPFHAWAPDVYAGSPTPVTALMAVGTKVGAFAALTLVFLIFIPHVHAAWSQVMSFFAMATMIYASLLALKQTEMNRFFAYSGIANAGFLLIPVIASTEHSIQSLLFYLMIYSGATLGSFSMLMQFDRANHSLLMSDLRGLFYRSPLTASILGLCLLTLAGVPPTAGFLAKFYLFKEAFQAGYYALVIVALLTTVLSIYYYVRMIGIMLAEPVEDDSIPYPEDSWKKALVGLTALSVVIILALYPLFL